MGFGKAFGVGFAVYVALNIIFIMIVYLLLGTIGDFLNSFTSDIGYIFAYLFAPSITLPGFNILLLLTFLVYGAEFLGTAAFQGLLILFIGFIVSPLIAAIITGKMAEGKMAAFGAWFLISMISSLVLMIVIIYISPTGSMMVATYGLMYGISEEQLLVYGIITGAVNGIFYGCFALLASGSEYY